MSRAWVGVGGEGGGGRSSERLGQVRRECRDSLYPGPGLDRFACLSMYSPEWGCGSFPLLGQPSLSVRLYLQESDRKRQSADTL